VKLVLTLNFFFALLAKDLTLEQIDLMWTDEGVEVLQHHEIPNTKEGGADADLKV